jgi:hypothetical protein
MLQKSTKKRSRKSRSKKARGYCKKYRCYRRRSTKGFCVKHDPFSTRPLCGIEREIDGRARICGKTATVRGLVCDACYQRARRGKIAVPGLTFKPCAEPGTGCTKPHYIGGRCWDHHQEVRRATVAGLRALKRPRFPTRPPPLVLCANPPCNKEHAPGSEYCGETCREEATATSAAPDTTAPPVEEDTPEDTPTTVSLVIVLDDPAEVRAAGLAENLRDRTWN